MKAIEKGTIGADKEVNKKKKGGRGDEVLL